MSNPLRVLIVEDLEDDALLIVRELRRSGYDPTFERVDTAETMKAALAGQTWDLIIADYSMPRFNGIEALALFQKSDLDLPFIIVSGTIGEEIAVAAMRAGAHDYVLKDNLLRLGPAVQRELHEAEERRARRRAEQLQRESEARFRRMADNIQDGLTIVEKGKAVYVNRRACEIFGYPEDEYVQMSLLDVAAPEERGRVGEIGDEIARTGRAPQVVELWVVRKDGTRRCVESRFSPSREGDEIIGHYVVTTDITERKLAEREIEERRRYLERVLSAAPDAIVTLDAEHRVAEWNSGAERLFGYSRDEVVGRDLDVLINKADSMEEAVGYTQRVMAGQELLSTEAVRYRKDGTPVDVIAAGSPILVEGRLIGAVAVYTDISERKRAERLLHALNAASLAMERALTPEEIFGTVGEEFKKVGFATAIFVTDQDRKRLFPRYLSYGLPAVRMAEKLIGIKVEDFSVPVESVEAFRKAVVERQSNLVEGEGAAQQALPGPLKRFAGQIIGILGSPRAIVTPLVVEDEVIGMLSVQSEDLIEDDVPAITAFAHQMAAAWRKAQLLQDLERSLEELRRIQAQLLQAQKMEALGRLAGGLAHDFNNLLTIVDISTRLLERQLQPEDPLWDHVQRIREAGERAAKLTRQLLSFSRPEMAEPRVVNLNDLVSDLGRMLQRLIGEDIRLVTHLAKDPWPVKVDPSQIEQVIVNLALNARDAMPRGGTLSIETGNKLLDDTYVAHHVDLRPGEHVVLTISDTGTGMGEEVKEHLFEPFFTTKKHGTGLGLATVFGIVKQSGGRIRVYSEVGKGTTFRIYLPKTREADVRVAPPAVHASTARGTETILVAEDEPAVRELATQILRSYGYKVLAAQNGLEALRVSRAYEGPIHLLLTDVVMPLMNGKELAEELQAEREEMRVLYVSGYSDDVIEHHGVLEEGAIFLAKPFTLEALTLEVRAVLDAPP
jgi:two-component system cell cycle sensor histidine kinase/response regulator CckA